MDGWCGSRCAITALPALAEALKRLARASHQQRVVPRT